MKLSDLFRLSVRSSEVSKEEWRVESEGVEIFGSDGIDLDEGRRSGGEEKTRREGINGDETDVSSSSQLSTLGFCFSRSLKEKTKTALERFLFVER